MRNITHLSLVIVSAIFLSACTAKAPNYTDTQAGGDKNTPTEESLTSSLRELIATGKNQKCSFTSSTTDDNNVTIDTSGTIYISGKRMFEEVLVKSNDKEPLNINTRMISDGTNIYSWEVAKKTPGVKFKMTEQNEVADSKSQNQSLDIDSKINMKCSPWMLDENMFKVPTDIQFNDLNEMMKNIPTMPANVSKGE